MQLQAKQRLTATELSLGALSKFFKSIGVNPALAKAFTIRRDDINGFHSYVSKSGTIPPKLAEDFSRLVTKHLGKPEKVIRNRTFWDLDGKGSIVVSLIGQTSPECQIRIVAVPDEIHLEKVSLSSEITTFLKSKGFSLNTQGGYLSADNGILEMQFSRDTKGIMIHFLPSTTIDPHGQEPIYETRAAALTVSYLAKLITNVMKSNKELLDHLGSEN
jgi:hypothetical protein